MKPPHPYPHSGLSGEPLFMRVKASEVPCSREQQRVVLSPAPTVPHTHGTPFVKQLIIAKHNTRETLLAAMK